MVRSFPLFSRFLTDYGMVFVLLLLCVYYSLVTLTEQYAGGTSGGEALARKILREQGPEAKVVIIAGTGRDDVPFAETLQTDLTRAGVTVLARVKGPPSEARKVLQKIAQGPDKPDVLAVSHLSSRWALLEHLDSRCPGLGPVKIMSPQGYLWPNFLKASNLLNIANQIAIIAILAIGMTMVIITGGIDLSVGSLIALSAVVATLLIRDLAGAENASALGMTLCCLAAIGVCALVGLFSGTLVTVCKLPPFIVTLGVMEMAAGMASKLAQEQSIYQVPESFVWLGAERICWASPMPWC